MKPLGRHTKTLEEQRRPLELSQEAVNDFGALPTRNFAFICFQLAELLQIELTSHSSLQLTLKLRSKLVLVKSTRNGRDCSTA